MEEKNYTGIVPDHHTGKKIDTEHSVTCDTEADAQSLYLLAKQRLLDVNNWQEVAGKALAHFQLTDATGNPLARTVHRGDFFKIDIPGPGSKSGEGFDWVQVETVEEMKQSFIESLGIRVRPASNPTTNSEDVSHFYSDKSTSNFVLTREGRTVTASVYDRNTTTNDNTDNLTDAIRSSAVGAGAIAIFSKIQWKNLVEGLLKRA